MKRGVLYFIVGAVLASVGNMVHVMTATSSYSHIDPLGLRAIPLWAPFLFGVTGLSMGFGYELFENQFLPYFEFAERATPPNALAGAMTFCFLYCLSGFLSALPVMAVTGLIACGALALWRALDGSAGGLLFSVVVSFLGTIFTSFLCELGLFEFNAHLHQLGHVPSWLPFLYVAGAMAAAQMSLVARGRLTRREPAKVIPFPKKAKFS